MKDEAAAAVGTSIEVLAPYLPYNLEVSWRLNESKLHLLTGLVAPSSTVYLEVYSACAEDCLPVLRPFSALCIPLADGTIPAVEVAKLMGLKRGVGKVQLEPEYIVIQADGDPRLAPCYVIERRRFDEDMYGGGIRRLLLSYHFAVGLEPHQYIEKTGGDYLVKEAGK